MSRGEASTGGVTRMPSSLGELLSSRGREDPPVSRDINTRIGALKARLTRASAASDGTTALGRNQSNTPESTAGVRLSSPHGTSPHLAEPFHARAPVGGVEPAYTASEIPRSSLSDAQYSEELYSARYNDQAAVDI